MEALGGEKIDIIDYSEQPDVFVGNSLAPSKVVRVDVTDHDMQIARACPDHQLSLAIGREGRTPSGRPTDRLEDRHPSGVRPGTDGEFVAGPPISDDVDLDAASGIDDSH